MNKVSGKPKGFIADTGLACVAQAISPPAAIGGHPLWGALFETAVVGALRKQYSFLSARPILHHWRSYSAAKVDLVIEKNGRYYPVASKAKTNPGRRDLSGIVAFRKRHLGLDVAAGLVLAPIEAPLQLAESDYALPWDLQPPR